MNGEEPKRYVTVAEAEALIPELEKIAGSLMDAHAQVEQIREALQAEQQRIMVSGGATVDTETWRERKATLDRLTDLLQEGVTEILSLGAVPKDLTLGLVDFPFLLHDREVNLCWRCGEKAIRFWHGLDEGYTARKSLYPASHTDI